MSSTTTNPPPRSRRMARQPKVAANPTELLALNPVAVAKVSKLDQLEALLVAPGGATIADMIAATGWQQHSVRGAMAGALKKRGLTTTSDKFEGVRRYNASKPT